MFYHTFVLYKCILLVHFPRIKNKSSHYASISGKVFEDAIFIWLMGSFVHPAPHDGIKAPVAQACRDRSAANTDGSRGNAVHFGNST